MVIVVNRPLEFERCDYITAMPVACLTWMQFGFGCLLVSVADENYNDNKFQELNRLITDTLLKFNQLHVSDNYPGTSVVHLEMIIKNPKKVIQMTQNARLFISKILKMSMTAEQFEAANGLYLITSDSDYIPLSTPMYHIYHHDWNLINVLQQEHSMLYVAMSCVGGYLNNWEELLDLSQYEQDLEIFENSIDPKWSGENILKIMAKEQIKLKDNSRDIEWFLDQYLLSKLLKDYGNHYGFSKTIYLRNPSQTSNLRLDRGHIKRKQWDKNNDLKYTHLFKDSHFCREIWHNNCWWKLYFALKPLFEKIEFNYLVEYRLNLTNIMMYNPRIGDSGATGKIRLQNIQRERLKGMHHGFDILKQWSSLDPKVYVDYTPKYVDWQHERLFRILNATDDKGKNHTMWYVIPKEDYLSKNKLPLYLKGSQEIKLQADANASPVIYSNY